MSTQWRIKITGMKGVDENYKTVIYYICQNECVSWFDLSIWDISKRMLWCYTRIALDITMIIL